MAGLFINSVRDIQDYRLFILFTIFCLDKKISPYFPFHNVGRSGILDYGWRASHMDTGGLIGNGQMELGNGAA